MAKDVVAGSGHQVVEFAEKSAVAAKDEAVSAGESVADYTARKKKKAERNIEAKKSDAGQGETGGEETEKEEMKNSSDESINGKLQESVTAPAEGLKEQGGEEEEARW
ncbi:hypothetical protein Nepgr_012927 [Nepenthes gracilis]|uniref:Uncharacterized protein n=1 Tax=Nepenthes gracilis TaxID=150966 RepID=A0AAD3XNT9_NEPGR|nr:hypothetical protein Nepgr_012927 [Nepenthes gracilis]